VPPIVLPRMSRGTALVVRMVAVTAPVVIVMVFAVLILFIGLFLGEERRKYALQAARWAARTSEAMTGLLPLGTSADDQRLDSPHVG
jgi:hypothetical protein